MCDGDSMDERNIPWTCQEGAPLATRCRAKTLTRSLYDLASKPLYGLPGGLLLPWLRGASHEGAVPLMKARGRPCGEFFYSLSVLLFCCSFVAILTPSWRPLGALLIPSLSGRLKHCASRCSQARYACASTPPRSPLFPPTPRAWLTHDPVHAGPLQGRALVHRSLHPAG